MIFFFQFNVEIQFTHWLLRRQSSARLLFPILIYFYLQHTPLELVVATILCLSNYHTNFVFIFIAEIVAPLRQILLSATFSLSFSLESPFLSSDEFCCAHKISTEKNKEIANWDSYAIYRWFAAVNCRCIYICAQNKISEF